MHLAINAAHGGNGGVPCGPSICLSAGAPLGAVGAEAATLLHAACRCSLEHGAANVLAGHRSKPAVKQRRRIEFGQCSAANWRCCLYPFALSSPSNFCTYSVSCINRYKNSCFKKSKQHTLQITFPSKMLRRFLQLNKLEPLV